jgi:arsenate reductase
MMTFNPQSEFAAILTCSKADGGCPFIAGAENVFQSFEDQKHLTITPQQTKKYQERSLQIATEMLYSPK